MVKYSYISDLHNNYYRQSSKYPRQLFKISKKEYFEKSGNKESNITKLKKSVYPYQAEDYTLLRIPKSQLERETRQRSGEQVSPVYVPADYKLTNIIKYLWKKNIITMGWGQGLFFDNQDYPGFITMEHKTTNGKDVLPILIKIFGEKNIKIFDYITNPKLEPSPGKTRIFLLLI